MPATRLPAPLLVIRPSRGWGALGLPELWSARELVALLAWRDIRVRYKQSALGAAWALLQPLLTLAAFAGIFGLLLGPERLPAPDGVPYALSTFCALAPWQLFARGVTGGSESIVANQALVTKVHFPRLVLPLAPVLGALVDFALCAAVLVALCVFAGITPGAGLALLPALVLLTVAAALGVSLWLSAINAFYRDVRVALPFAMQLWMLGTPVVYSAPRVLEGRPDGFAVLYGLNPMVGVVEGFRHALLGGAPPWSLLASSAVVTSLLLASGLAVFRALEPDFADRV
jgi:lipopolysaccharide transport system permease protein